MICTTLLNFGVLILPLVGCSAFIPQLRMRDLNGLAKFERPADALDTNQWMSFSKDVQFLPVLEQKQRQQQQRAWEERRLRKLDEDEDENEESEYNPYSMQPFTDSTSDYSSYQQAWRMLGFMIDCDATDGESQNNQRNNRNHNGEAEDDGCARFVVWAAYLDLEYQGYGIGEYQYWDRETQTWDDSACQYGGSYRCAKMDCHLDDTSFALLGFFKHRSYDDWMGQLFKHEGMCVWSEEEYAFMKNARKVWPHGCVNTGESTFDGRTLYKDIKPTSNGSIAFALYTDSKCTVEYSSKPSVVESTLGYNPFAQSGGGSHDNNAYSDYDFSGDSMAQSMDRWNSAFSEWTTCHPCVAYDVENTDGQKYLYSDRNRRELDGNHGPEGKMFECYDDAGYTNVNQCMKFSAKTVMNTATFRDLALGNMQQTLIVNEMSKYYDNSFQRDSIGNFLTNFFFAASMLCLVASLVCCYRSKRHGEYDVDGALKDRFLRRRGIDKHVKCDDESSTASSKDSVDSKEKPLIDDELADISVE